MSSGAGCSKPGKRKRSASDLEDIENAWAAEKSEQRRKRVRESPPTSPPLTPLTPNVTALDVQSLQLVETSNSRKSRACSSSESRSGLMSPLSFLNRNGLLDLMGQVDSRSDVAADYLTSHPGLQPRMRSVLLDWLMEVCEAYKMHRETYYLALNYLDRYLSRTRNVAKTQLQLIGITCLFIAAKVEEIYPPKAAEFSYVTNEACSLEDILKQELLILSVLDWNINALTVHGWLSLLLQLWHNRDAAQPKSLLMPNHPIREYLLTTQLVDVATMDEGCLRFPYLPLAAAVIHVITDYKDVLHSLPVRISALDRELMSECVTWLAPFADVIRAKEMASPVKCNTTDYTLQSHCTDLKLLESVQERVKELQYSSVVMTPPPSSGKPATTL